jgi:hypothetical protein
MKCAASPGGTTWYCIAGQPAVNTVKQGTQTVSSRARMGATQQDMGTTQRKQRRHAAK